LGTLALDDVPGFRRRFLVVPQTRQVTAAVEDDYHCMAVTLHHDRVTVTEAAGIMQRMPWTTCPGAPAVLKATFEGVELAEVAGRGAKQANCTHLHDLAVLAAAHAFDVGNTGYEILVCDPMDGLVTAEIRRDGVAIHRIEHRDNIVTTPEAIAGVSVFKLRGWIESLDGLEKEAARLLQWGTILAHGRTTPMERQSDASRMPPNCFTFQPENAVNAIRVGEVIDFSTSQREPLSYFDGGTFTSQKRPDIAAGPLR
jgi:Protein of unknown function (DUF2889)